MATLKWWGASDVRERYGIERRTFYKYADQISRCRRYPAGCVIRGTSGTKVLDTVMHDFMRRKFDLDHKIDIPPYSASETRLELARLEG